MAQEILGEAGLHFDELNKLRVLDPEVAQQTVELKEECRVFVDSKCSPSAEPIRLGGQVRQCAGPPCRDSAPPVAYEAGPIGGEIQFFFIRRVPPHFPIITEV